MVLPGQRPLRLVVVPSDPIEAYEREGLDWLARYYNPTGMFREVYALSPLETGERRAHGMIIRGVKKGEFRAALQTIRPDVVRAYGGFWPADLACYSSVPGIPVVVSVHDTNPSNIHRSLRAADVVICVSKAVAAAVERRSVDPARIRLLPNRIDLDVFRRFTAPEALESLNRQFPAGRHILHVGRKDRQKNLETVIRALVQLPMSYHGVFVGRGDPTPYQVLAKECGVSDRCFWVESVKNAELPQWYSWCDCFCVPSRWEGFGIVFIEAAACGAPIVTSDIAPMNEYLKHGVSAELVGDYEDPQLVADAIRRVCEDHSYRQKLSEGAVRAAIPFDRKAVDVAEAAIYREAIAAGPQPLPISVSLEACMWRARRWVKQARRKFFVDKS